MQMSPISWLLDASFVVRGSHEIDGEVADDGHVFGAVAFSQARLVLFEGYVEHPVKLVLDAPMSAQAWAACLAVSGCEEI